MKKNKTPLLIAVVVLDVALITFFLVVSIMLIATVSKYKTPENALANTTGLIHGILAMGKWPSFFAFVVPMFLVLAANIIGLMLFVRKTTKKEPAKISDLSDEQKEALRQELLKDLQGGNKEEKPAEENKES